MEFNNWHDFIAAGVALIVFVFGANIINLIKAALVAIFKKEIKDKVALVVAGVVAGGLAVLEMWLTGQFTDWNVTAANFPAYFGVVFSFATVWFKLFLAG